VSAIQPGAEVERVKRARPESLASYDLMLRSQPEVYSGMPARGAERYRTA